MASLENTEIAQVRALELLGDKPYVSGIGITRVGDGFGLRVNLEAVPDDDVPSEIAGVPVSVRYVGPVRALDHRGG